MIKKIYVTNYLNETLEVELANPYKTGFVITSIEGLGPPKATISTLATSYKDGTTFSKSKAEQRNIVLGIKFDNSRISDSIEDIRQKTYRVFPIKRKLKFKIETTNKTVFTEGYVESNTPAIFDREEGTSISILCPDSFFYSEEIEKTFFNSTKPLFEFPFSNESLTEKQLIFSEQQQLSDNYIKYSGDEEVGIEMLINITGDVTNISVINNLTREIMRINSGRFAQVVGSGIADKDLIIINTTIDNRGITLIREGISYNILNSLDRYTDWIRLSEGYNVFSIYADSGIENIQAEIRNRIRYEGV